MEFKSKAPVLDVAVAAFTDIFFLLSVYVWIFYKSDTRILSLILLICGIGCSWCIIKRPTYVFDKTGLWINEHKPFKSVLIKYKDIAAYEIKGNFQSIKTKASGKLVLTYFDCENQKYRSMICMLDDVYGFVEVLKKYSGKKFDNNDWAY